MAYDYTFHQGQTVEMFKLVMAPNGRPFYWQCIGFASVAEVGSGFLKIVPLGESSLSARSEWIPMQSPNSYVRPIG